MLFQLAIAAVSWECPCRLVLQVMPRFRRMSWYSSLAQVLPLSEGCTGPGSGQCPATITFPR
ncbi:MAG: hypothetical protein AB1730_23415 [Myxococcota bacterium]